MQIPLRRHGLFRTPIILLHNIFSEHGMTCYSVQLVNEYAALFPDQWKLQKLHSEGEGTPKDISSHPEPDGSMEKLMESVAASPILLIYKGAGVFFWALPLMLQSYCIVACLCVEYPDSLGLQTWLHLAVPV